MFKKSIVFFFLSVSSMICSAQELKDSKVTDRLQIDSTRSIVYKIDESHFSYLIEEEGDSKYSKFSFDETYLEIKSNQDSIISLKCDSGLVEFDYFLEDNNFIGLISIKDKNEYLEIHFTDIGEVGYYFYCDYDLCNTCFDKKFIYSSITKFDYLPFSCGGAKNHEVYTYSCQKRKAFKITESTYYEGEFIDVKAVPFESNFRD